MAKVNLKNVSEDGNSLAPEGLYLWNIAKATDRIIGDSGKNAGEAMIALELKLKCDANGDTAHAGTVAWDNLVLVGKALSRVKMLLKQAGMPADDDDMEISAMDVRGLDIWAVTYHDTHEGRINNKITFDGYHRKHVPANPPKIGDQGFGSSTKDEEIPF